MSDVAPYVAQPAATILTVTIAAGQSLSAAVSCGQGGTLIRIYTPMGWDSNELLTFQVSPDGTAFYNLFYPSDREVVFTITPGAVIYSKDYDFSANNWIKLRSGLSTNPRPQSAARTFQLALM